MRLLRLRRLVPSSMVAVAQLVRAPDCGSGGCGFNPRQPPSVTTRRFALLGIAALVAWSCSSTPVDLSALDLSGRWMFLDSATALQADTDSVYATVVARGTVVLATLGAGTYTMSSAFSLHFTLIDSTA